jgi:hypothetical protein
MATNETATGVMRWLVALKERWASDGFFTLSAFLLSLLPRLYVALAWTREPVWDGHYYHFGATRIASGFGYSEDVVVSGLPVWKPWCHYPVGYSGFLGGLYKVFGAELWVAPVANALVSALTVAVVHRIALAWLPLGRARFAALLCALHPGLILYTGVVMTEGLSALLLLLVLLGALAPHRQRVGGVLSGVALGLGALVRPTVLLAGPLLLRVFRGNAKSVAIATTISAVSTLCVIAPWTLRNCKVMDGCALISTNGGWNLAIGALTETGRFRTLTAKDGCPIVTGQVQQDRCWGDLGRERIAADPKTWLGLIPKKLEHTYNHESFAVGYLAEANPGPFAGTRRETLRAATTGFHHLLMLTASLAGIALVLPSRNTLRDLVRGHLPKFRAASVASLPLAGLVQWGLLLAVAFWVLYASSNPEHPFFWLIVVCPLLLWIPLPGSPPGHRVGWFLSGLVLATTVTHAVFFGEDRYHITVSPVLCLLAAAALRHDTTLGLEGREPDLSSATHAGERGT